MEETSKYGGGDKWLPIPTTYVIQTPRRILAKQARAEEVIDPGTKSWNLALIQAVFKEVEAQIISNIPLSSLQPKDRLIWRGTTSGKFTVRNAFTWKLRNKGIV
jgi:hypothetical protein